MKHINAVRGSVQRFLPAGVAATLLGFGQAIPAQNQPEVEPPPQPSGQPATTQAPVQPVVPPGQQPLPTAPGQSQQPVTPAFPGQPPTEGQQPTETPGETPLPIEPQAEPPTEFIPQGIDPLIELRRSPLAPGVFEPLPAGSVFLDPPVTPPPWLSGDAPTAPDWDPQQHPSTPFMNPSLGTPMLGYPLLTEIPPPPRRTRRQPTVPIHLGPIDMRPGLTYQTLYGSGAHSAPGVEAETWQNSITPSMTFYAGDQWVLRYAPRIRIYSSDAYKDTFDQAISLSGTAAFGNWRFGVTHATTTTSDPLIETGRQTDQTTHNTAVNGIWNRGRRGMLTLGFAQSIRLPTSRVDPDISDSYSWSSENWYDYPVRPQLRVGLGVSFGYDWVLSGTDMFYERVMARIYGRLGTKITYNLNAGGQFRQVLESGSEVSITPSVSANIKYDLFEKTGISIGFSHDVRNSYFIDQFNETTSVQARVIQAITDRWSLSVAGGYRLSSYQSIQSGFAVQREDTSTFADVSVGGFILPRVRLSLIYSFRNNDSSQDTLSFDSHQMGMSLSWNL